MHATELFRICQLYLSSLYIYGFRRIRVNLMVA